MVLISILVYIIFFFIFILLNTIEKKLFILLTETNGEILQTTLRSFLKIEHCKN